MTTNAGGVDEASMVVVAISVEVAAILFPFMFPYEIFPAGKSHNPTPPRRTSTKETKMTVTIFILALSIALRMRKRFF